MVLFELLRSNGSIVVNKKLARGIGLHEAIIYSELISKYLYFSKRNELQEGYFYNTIENLEKDTTLSVYQQRNAIANLVKQKLITYTLKGNPAKRYFRILVNDETLKKLSKILSDERPPKTSLRETHKLDCEKLANYKDNTNNDTKLKISSFRGSLKETPKTSSFRKEEEDSYIPDYDPSKKKDIDNRTPEELKKDRLRIAELAHQARIEMSRKELVLVK